GAAFSYSASATDVLDGSVATSCTPASGSTFPFGVTTVTCSATDGHGNTGSASFRVIVVDTTPPVVTPPAALTVAATQAEGASGNLGSASSVLSVTAPVGGVVDVANQPVVATNAQNAPQPVTVSFATVTQPGLLTADGIDAPAPPPAGFTFAGSGVLDIGTTA